MVVVTDPPGGTFPHAIEVMLFCPCASEYAETPTPVMLPVPDLPRFEHFNIDPDGARITAANST